MFYLLKDTFPYLQVWLPQQHRHQLSWQLRLTAGKIPLVQLTLPMHLWIDAGWHWGSMQAISLHEHNFSDSCNCFKIIKFALKLEKIQFLETANTTLTVLLYSLENNSSNLPKIITANRLFTNELAVEIM